MPRALTRIESSGSVDDVTHADSGSEVEHDVGLVDEAVDELRIEDRAADEPYALHGFVEVARLPCGQQVEDGDVVAFLAQGVDEV